MGVKVRAVPGTAGFARTDPPWWRRVGVSVFHDWGSFLFWRCNWSDFTLIEVSGEIEWCMSNAELSAALFGFHVRLTYYWPSEMRDEMKAQARLIEAGFLGTVESPDTIP